MCVLTMLALMLVATLVLGVQLRQPWLLIVPIVATAICFTGLMMVAAVMGKTEQAVAGASWGAMMPFAMIGGGMIPLIAMPPWLQSLSDFSPFKWAIYSIEGAVWRGLGFTELLGPCAILVALGAAFFGIGLLIYRKTYA